MNRGIALALCLSALSGCAQAHKIGDFYDSFMDEARVESLGLAPLKDQHRAASACPIATTT